MFKNILFSLIWYLFIISSTFASMNLWGDKIDPGLKWWNDNLEKTVENVFTYLLTFLYLVSIILAVYAWFVILTSAWNEDRVKKWKSILVFVAVWIIIIFLASTFIRWLIKVLQSDEIIWFIGGVFS